MLAYLHLLLLVLVQTNFTFLLLQLGSLWYVSNAISAFFLFIHLYIANFHHTTKLFPLLF